ncbi:hypothetical protein VR46_06925 [Streptomyces sp. NRRL S-444]|nr:hypothetical protein VR46_06925 [Streptomyces sp. NRRL S-444]
MHCYGFAIGVGVGAPLPAAMPLRLPRKTVLARLITVFGPGLGQAAGAPPCSLVSRRRGSCWSGSRRAARVRWT